MDDDKYYQTRNDIFETIEVHKRTATELASCSEQ